LRGLENVTRLEPFHWIRVGELERETQVVVREEPDAFKSIHSLHYLVIAHDRWIVGVERFAAFGRTKRPFASC